MSSPKPLLTAPFPYFGGKRRAAHLVWERFGAVRNYVEPFAGSLAVLLSVSHDPGRIETVNDANGYLCNFWRAVQADPEAVASWADWPVSELDLHARHRWLVTGPGAEEFRESMRADPDHYDVKRAGWWVWGACCWIGSGWAMWHQKLQLPHVGDAGRGLNRKLPHVGDAGRGAYIRETMQALQDRLRDVRICCGDWARVTGPSVTTKHGLTGVFLDPPYGAEWQDASVYGVQHDGVAEATRQWAIANGDNTLLRIALCGYEDEHSDLMPPGWQCVAWKAGGGYGGQRADGSNANRHRERIWFSPHCLRPGDGLLTEEATCQL